MSQRIKTILYVLLLCGAWAWANERDYQEAAYTRELEKVLAKCLSGGDQPLIIGSRLFMCGSVDTGIEVKI